jgi:hypothetical protein
MTQSFVEELFLRIEERIAVLEKEIGEIRTDVAIIAEEIARCKECRKEIEGLRPWFRVGRNVAFFIWGLVVTALNILIGKWLGK